MAEPDLVGPQELLGRRLFGKIELDAKRPVFDYTHFVDSRFEADLSVDLLGTGNPENKRVRFFTVVADSEATARRPATTFEGWAAILAKDLQFPGWSKNVARVPITMDDGNINPHHAEIPREGFREKRYAYTFATMMADRFLAEAATSHLSGNGATFAKREYLDQFDLVLRWPRQTDASA